MSQHTNDSNLLDPAWDAAGRTVEAKQAEGHAVEQLTAVQLALVSMGYSINDQLTQNAVDDCSAGDGVDGLWSAATARAIAQFQDDRGIESTGRLDDETEEAILSAYDEALLAGGSSILSDDEPDAVQMRRPNPLAQAATQTAGVDALSDNIDALVPGELPDEPEASLLLDADSLKKL